MPAASLVLGGIRIKITADDLCAPGLERFIRAWGSAPALGEQDPVDSEVKAFVDSESGDVVIEAGPLREENAFAPKDSHLSMERAVYHELTRLLPTDQRMLHAGCVSGRQGTWLFLGESGAGKSSHCLAAVKAGYRYLSDDILMTDGTTVWGVPRAIQFDAPRKETPFPVWLEAASLDFQTYAGAGPDAPQGEDYTCPLFIPGRAATLDQVPAAEVHLVFLEPASENALTLIPTARALGHLLSSAHAPAKDVDLGKLAMGGAYHLKWKSPGEALRLLEQLAAKEAR